MTAPAYIPAASLHDMSQEALVEALADFCEAEGLRHTDAMELILSVTNANQAEWLRAFLVAWEAAQEPEDDLGMVCPSCGHVGSFMVAATVWGMMSGEGFNQDHDALPDRDSDYDEYAACICPSCQKTGIVQEFQA